MVAKFLLLWPPGAKNGVRFEAAIGFFCLPPAFAALLLAAGDEVGVQPFWVVVSIFLLGGAIALIFQAVRVKRGAQEWRNTEREGPF
jgi:RsiW-degrading membrane proteinase PrsW (M82 family)